MQQASISSRFAAMNLDMLIYTALWQGVSMLIERNAPEFANSGIFISLSFIFAILYFVVPTKLSGQTLGKKLIGLKVVPQSGDKEPVSWLQAFLREIVGKILSTIPFFLGYLWAKWSPDRKAWHDSISRTQVVSLVWEEERTFMQKLQQTMLGILSIPLGVALILGAFLYTSLPLDSIKEKIEAAGIQVGSLTGSLAGGLRFSEIRRHDENQNFSLGSVDVKFNVSALVYDRQFIIEKLTAEEGHIEVPPDFSWYTVFVNLMNLGQGGQGDEGGLMLGNFKMAKMHLKNISFEYQKKVISQLQELSIRNLEMADQELSIGEAQFQIPGFTIKTVDFKSFHGRIEVSSAIGGMGPEFLPLLKVPVDFHVKGVIGKNPRTTKFDGGMTIDKIKFAYDGGKFNMTVDKLLLNEMFKTALPLEDLDMKLTAEGETALDLMSSINIEYGLKVCGNEFKPDPAKGPLFARADRTFTFAMMPKPVENFSKTIFAPAATLDDLFAYEMKGKKQISPGFANPKEMVADLCYQKNIAALQSPELEKLQGLIAAATTAHPSGGSLQALLSKSVPITVAPPAAVSTTAEQARTAMTEARGLLRSGKYVEAKAALENVHLAAETLPPVEAGSFYNLKAWVYLYSSQPTEAAHSFDQAFQLRKDIADAEGLVRANEDLKNEDEAQKWLEYMRTSLKENPDLKSHLSPNMQKRFTESPPAAAPAAPTSTSEGAEE